MVVTVTGTLTSFGGVAIPAGLRPELWFVPTGTGRRGGQLLTAEHVRATLTGAAWSAQLEVTAGVVPPRKYRPLVKHFREDGKFAAEYFVDFEFPVPFGGGDISTFPDVELGPWTILTQLEDPEPSGYKGYWRHGGPGDPDAGAPTGSGNVYLIY